MKYEQLVSMIIEKIGGKENVNSVVHCTTRLRFKLKDEKKQIQSFLKSGWYCHGRSKWRSVSSGDW